MFIFRCHQGVMIWPRANIRRVRTMTAISIVPRASIGLKPGVFDAPLRGCGA